MATAVRSSPPEGPPRSAAQSGVVLGVASLVAIALNYVFLLAAGRILGSNDYGALAALLGLLTLIVLPTGAVQLAVSREVSRRVAVGDDEGAAAVGRAMLRLGLIAGVPFVVLGLLLVVPLRELLNIGSTSAVALAMAGLAAALVLPISLGLLQGYQRFSAIAALYVLPFVIRLALLALVAAAGYRLGGAVLAAVVAGLATAVVALWLLRPQLSQTTRLADRAELVAFLRFLGPVLVGLLGIAVLTTVDLLVVKARFSPGAAGEYAAASAFARIAFFLPATILTVLFPRTAARQARGEETEDILGRSLLVVAAFGGLLTLFYALAGRGLVQTSFGAEFAGGGDLLVLFSLSMTLFSLANVLVGFHLSRGETRYAWIVAAAVPVQLAVLALVPTTPEGVILANIVIATTLLGVHELVVDSSVPALRAGTVHFAKQAASLRVRRLLTEGVVVVLGATVLVCALFWPVVVHLGSTIMGTPGSDSTGSVWWFWRAVHESGFHVLGTTHHVLTGAPFGWDEGNGLNAQWFFPYYPTYLLARVVGEVAAYNVAVLSGYVLSATVMYVLVRYLGCAVPVAAWAALVFVVFPWHLARVEHASLVHIEVLALLVLVLVAAAREPSLPRYALVCTATFACWLTSGYFGTMAVITVVAFSVGAALTMPRRRGVSLVLGSTVAALGGSFVVGLAAVVSGVGRGGGLERMAGDLSGYGLRLHELLVAAPGNLVLGDRLRSFHEARLHGSNLTEASTYLGLLTIALAVVWVVRALRRRKTLSGNLRSATAGLVAATVVGLVCGAPSPVSVLGHDLWMPSRLIWELTPAFRVPSRWVVLVMAALVPLAALGLQAGWQAVARHGLRAQVGLVSVAIVVSFLELTISPAEARFRTQPLPPEYAALERTPPGIVAEYPLGSSDLYLLWQTRHGRPLLNGAPAGTTGDDVRRVLLDPATPGVASALAALGVTTIVIHPHAHVDVEVEPRQPGPDSGFTRVTRLPDGTSVWRVVAIPAPAIVTLAGGFAPPRRYESGEIGYALDSPAGVGVVEFTAKEPGVVQLAFDAAPPAGAKRTLRLADADQEREFVIDDRTRVTVPVEVPRGRSYLELKTDPAATSEEDAVVVGVPRAMRTSRPAELHAIQISSDPGY